MALENATEDNGCLWSVPGSHKPYKNEPKVNKPGKFMNELYLEGLCTVES